MDWFTRNSSPLSLLSALADANVAYKAAIGVVLLTLLIQKFKPAKSRPYNLFPTWASIEIAIATYALQGDGLGRRVFSSIRRYGGSLYGVTSKHQVLAQYPDLDRILSQSYHHLIAEPVQYTIMTRVFGDCESPDLQRKLLISRKDLMIPLERLFLNEAAASAAIDKAFIHREAASLVTFSSNYSEMKRWERSADIKVLAPALNGNPGVAEANLQSLTRDFGACMSIPLLYGKDFLDRYPQLLDDFWKFDNDMFAMLMIGVPTWLPFKAIREGRAAKTRLLREMEALYRRIDQYQRGDPVDFGADMSDLGTPPLERNKIFVRDDWSFEERATADFTILWAQNANTQPMLFWFLVYVYSTPGLLDRIREEISSYVNLSKNFPHDILSIDIPALSRNCQLFKACIFETYRMVNEPTSVRYVAKPMTLTDGDFEHKLQPGTFVSVPYTLDNYDPAIFSDPEQFTPERFLEMDTESGKPAARYGRLRPWGVGAAMCKGRTFAEKEIVTAGAAIISLWDINPVGNVWELPPSMPGTGVKKPVKDIRVAISQRKM
ncbi:putative cytochrome P450 [Mariannaea sp. PMI_226]|nr:putative cytochrome P450 [Mariannaea sp. PMI_226]